MGARDPSGYSVAWAAQPGPQTALLRCPVFEVFYGGARGGGKTDGVLGEFAQHASIYGEGAIGLMVRRELTQLIETIERSREIYGPVGAVYHAQDKLWRFPNGARLRFAYLERDSDADAYQGHSYSRVYVEEIGTFPSPAPIMKLMATLRSGKGVPVGFRATGNPGGPGQHWVKARYIDPHPAGWKVIRTPFTDPFSGETISRDRVYIPSRVTDNRFLGAEYVANLQMSGAPELVKAWLEGDWTVIAGAFFPEFSMASHVVPPVKLPDHWTRFRACDWGSARPFSVGWYAVSDGELEQFPRGALVKYREWYGVRPTPDGFEPNVGLKMTAEEVAEGIRKLEGEETKRLNGNSVMDPAAFAVDGGPSIAERMQRLGVIFRRADNKRVAQQGALGGWDQLRQRLKGADRPMLYFFSTCLHTIRTLPALQHDAMKPEDVDTDGEDHAPDETRYACMARPWIHKPETSAIRYPQDLTINELIKRVGDRRRAEE